MKKNLKNILALCLTLALVFALAACGQKTDVPDEPDEQQTEQQTENDTPAHYSIAALKGPTAMGLVKLMQDSESGETSGNDYTFTLAGSADEVTPALIKGELDMACVPANLAAVKEREQFSRSASMTMVKFSCKIVWLISRTFTFHFASSELTPAIIPTRFFPSTVIMAFILCSPFGFCR